VGLGLVCKLMQDTGLSGIKREAGLDRESVVLCFSTEGNTDPENYAAILNTQ